MPVVSKAQNAAMHAAIAGHSTLGIPKSVGADFIAATPPGSVKKLPQHVKLKPTAKPRKPPLPKSAGHMVFGSLAPGEEDSGAS